jgi:amino acid transporter
VRNRNRIGEIGAEPRMKGFAAGLRYELCVSNASYAAESQLPHAISSGQQAVVVYQSSDDCRHHGNFIDASYRAILKRPEWRRGVYRVVKEAMGGTLAKFSVSALMFDYILTGPISGVSAGLYLTGLLNELLHYAHFRLVLPMDGTAAIFAVMVTLYFWWENTRGIPESSEKALRIMYVTTVMVVMMIAWCGYTLWVRGAHLPPWPHLSSLVYSNDALGWLRHTSLPYTVGLIGILVGLGHSVLAMSGEETMAQVYREIEHPKLKNLEKAGFVIFAYSLIFTAGVAFFAVMIIPDAVRNSFFDNPIGGLAMYLVGPLSLRLAFRAFVVVVGVLMLAGAVNTAIVGSNGVLNRVSEDGILPHWFRQPHRRFGTSHRILNTVVGLQLLPEANSSDIAMR